MNPYNGDPYAKEFGVTFENKLTIIMGRVLPPPMVSVFRSISTDCICFSVFHKLSVVLAEIW